MIARRPDWATRLDDLIMARRDGRFDMGVRDCSTWAADAVLAMTGVDVAAPIRGYTTAEGAVRRLRKVGCGSIITYVDRIFPRADVAARGDVVAIPAPPIGALMVADGPGFAWGQDDAGLVLMPIPRGAIIWSV